VLEKLKNFKLDIESGINASINSVDDNCYELSVHVSDLVLKPRMQGAWKNFDSNLRAGNVRSGVADFRSFTKPVQFSLLLRAFAERYPGLSMEYVVVNDTAKEMAHRVLSEFERATGRRIVYWQGRTPQWRIGIQGSEKSDAKARVEAGVDTKEGEVVSDAKQKADVENDAEQYFLKQTFDVECMPIPVELDLAKFDYESYDVEVTEDDITASLDAMRQGVTRGVECAPRPARDGDTLVLDVRIGGVGGAPETRDGIEMRIGGALFPPEFQKLCIGKRAGDEVKYNFPIPRQLDDPALAGKVLTLRALIREVRDTVTFDKIDEDFAAACGKDLQQLRADERTKLEKRAEELCFVFIGMQLRKFILDTQKIDAPAGYVAHKAKGVWKQMFNDAIPWNYQSLESTTIPKAELDALHERVLRTVAGEVVSEAVFTEYQNKHNLVLTEAELAEAKLNYAQTRYNAIHQIHMLGANQADLAEVMTKDPAAMAQVEIMAMSRKIINHIFGRAPKPRVTKIGFVDFVAQINERFVSAANAESGKSEKDVNHTQAPSKSHASTTSDTPGTTKASIKAKIQEPGAVDTKLTTTPAPDKKDKKLATESGSSGTKQDTGRKAPVSESSVATPKAKASGTKRQPTSTQASNKHTQNKTK
jgi:FKBP-type peptidyl-prolyl cis-trans isomerase (trigger factor)